MKNKRILSKVFSLVLCAVVLLGSVTVAYGSTDVDNSYGEVYTEIGTENIGGSSSDGITDSDKSADEPNVSFFFAFLRDEPNLFGSKILATLILGSKIKVLSYSGMYAYVEVAKTHQKGYIFSLLLDDKFEFNKEYDHVYVNQTNSARLKIKNGADVEWTVSPSGYISVDPETKIITGIKPGTVTITAKGGMSNVSCTITCINPWKEQETATAEKNIDVFPVYNAGFEKNGIITKGSVITAKGDLADGSGWIYVNSGGTWGFIKLSDFPGIDYLLTEYHYYDQGYEIRFSNVNNNTPAQNIYNYTSVLNDVVMKLFKLKVCSYVNEYTSLADTCKALSYGEVNKNNISKPCPKTQSHNINSCLERGVLWKQFKTDVGYGNNTTIKLLWTGHILPNHQVSAAQNGSESIIMTTANTVSHNKNTNTYSNKPDAEIRKYSLYTLTHETAHLLGTVDGYCKNDNGTDHCSNENCYLCNEKPIPTCVMVQPFSPEESNVVFCDECLKTMENHLKDHH